jgi:tetratricopeptide (TPR) repeat protein
VQSERNARERDQATHQREEIERSAKLTTEVGAALAEATVHQGGGRWSEAILSAERAKALATGGGASSELLGRVDAVLAELHSGSERAEQAAEREADNKRLVSELLEAREPIWNPGGEDEQQSNTNFEAVFKHHGIDIDAGTPEQVAAALKQRGFGSEIALFLDSLAAIRRKAQNVEGTGRALDVAHAVDPDPLRADLREALAAGALDVLRGIVKSGFEDQPAITIELLGSALQELGQREEARAVYRRGIERFPGDFSLYYRLARMLTPPELDTGVRSEVLEAIESYRAALALRPDSTVVRYYLGRLYYKIDQPDRSIEQFTIALKQRPDDGTFLFQIAVDQFALGRPAPAEAILRKLVDRDRPSWLASWSAYMLGRCLLARGQEREATAFFQRAVDSNPGNPVFIGGLLDGTFASGSTADRDRVVGNALELFEKNGDMLNTIAWSLATAAKVEMRDLVRALPLAQRSTELRPQSDAAWNTLGVTRFYAGDMAGAVDALRHSVRLQGAGNVTDWIFLALASKRMGNEGEAQDWYDRVVDWMGTHANADPETVRFRAEADQLFKR